MKVILTTVNSASVTVLNKVIGKIDRGFLLLVGFTFGDDEEVKVYTLANVEDEQELTSEDLLFIWKNGKIIKSYTKSKKTPKKESLSLKESPRYKDLVKVNDTTWKYKDKVTIGYNEYGIILYLSQVN